MLRDLSLYAFLNAKVKAMFSFLLSPEQREALTRAPHPEEFFRLLGLTPYREIAARPEVVADPRRLEKELLLYDIGLHKKIMAAKKGQTGEIVFGLLERYDRQNFKAVLRLWFQPQEREEELPYLIEETICYPLPIKKILSARTLDDVLGYLGESPYREPLAQARELFRQKRTLFPLEAALDVDYYSRLNDRIEALRSSDREIALRLIGTEIDIENIKLLLRLREYYRLPFSEVFSYLIPSGNRINPGMLRNLALSEDIRSALARAAAGPYRRIQKLLAGRFDSSSFALLEAALWEILIKEARTAFRSAPFTIATVLAYLMFKVAETRFLVSTLYTKLLAEGTR
ncbi:MAG: V-type ATPase subunit [PVC group bacterium]